MRSQASNLVSQAVQHKFPLGERVLSFKADAGGKIPHCFLMDRGLVDLHRMTFQPRQWWNWRWADSKLAQVL